MGVLDALGRRLGVEVQTGKVAGVGVVAEPDVDRIGALVHSGLQRGQITGGTDQFQRFGRERWGRREHNDKGPWEGG
jgi:hypothetical protein